MGIIISNSQRLWLGFSLRKYSFQYVGNVGIYSVDSSREGLTRETLTKISCHHLSWFFAFQSYFRHMLHFAGRLLTSYPWKLLWSSIALSFHTLSHTQPLQWNHTNNTGYIRLNIITIKFGTELKPIQNSCKSQLYIYCYFFQIMV